MKETAVNQYEYENMLNSNRQSAASSAIRYSPAPTAPKLEVTINQNCDASSQSGSPVRKPPPCGPPPPPPSEYAEPILSARKPEKKPQRRRCDNTATMFKVALFEGLIAAFMLAGGIWCLCDTPDYCPYYSAVWTSAVFLLNSLLGMAAAKRGAVNLFVAYLVLSLISLMLCAVSAAISARNWFLIGTYQHPKIDRNQAFCLIGEHDASRVRYIFTQLNRYDFKRCLLQLKVGIAVNSVQFIVAGIEGCFMDEPLIHGDNCYQWFPLIKVNESTKETFDRNLCENHPRRHSIAIESKEEWEFVKEIITNGMYEAKQANMTAVYLILGGVQRFGKMEPELAYKKYLRKSGFSNNISPCLRYAVVAKWLNESELMEPHVRAIPCNKLEKYVWNVMCKRTFREVISIDNPKHHGSRMAGYKKYCRGCYCVAV